MGNELRARARRVLLQQIAPVYHDASGPQKQQILEEFVSATGNARKYALWLLHHAEEVFTPTSALRRRYGPEVEEVLVLIWKTLNRICTKRLIPFLPDIRIASREILPAGKILASFLSLCWSISRPIPVRIAVLQETPDQRTLLAGSGTISHEASGKAHGRRGVLIRTISPHPLTCPHTGLRASHTSSHRETIGLEQGCGVRFTSSLTTSHGRRRFQEEENVSCCARIL